MGFAIGDSKELNMVGCDMKWALLIWLDLFANDVICYLLMLFIGGEGRKKWDILNYNKNITFL